MIIRPKPNSGSDFYNYKHSFSIVLLALVDADYRFIFVDIGTNGRISDGGVFEKSALSRRLEAGQLNIPRDKPLPGRSKVMPYVIVADEAFPLKRNVMKPYSGKSTDSVQKRIYNYRLSRARRVVENSFGILANRFRVFLAPIALRPESVELIVRTACVLHNVIRSHEVNANANVNAIAPDVPTGMSDTSVASNGTWQPLAKSASHRATEHAQGVRNEFCAFFYEQGVVPWQDAMLRDY